MFIVAVWFEVVPEHAAEFRQAVNQQAANSVEHEPDCHQFDVCADPANPGRIFLYEVYTSAAAFQLHQQTAHFANFQQTVGPWIASKQVQTWQRIASGSAVESQ